MLKGYAIIGVLLVITFAGLWSLLEGYYLLAVVLHFACVVCGLLASAHSAQKGHSRGFDITLSMCVPVAGGLLCALASHIVASKRGSVVVDDYMRHIDPEEYRTFFEEEKSEFKPEPEKLQPLSDILYSRASIAEKRIAIEALAQMECPESVKILRDALKMDSVEVRFFAASVLTRLEARLSERMKELENKSSDDSEGLYEMAQASFDYAFYGMAEGHRREKYLAVARDYVCKSLETEPSVRAYSLLGRIQIQLHDYQGAKESFVNQMQMRGGDNSSLVWQAEAAFEQRDFGEVIRLCNEMVEKNAVPQKLKPAIECWNLREVK